MAAAGKQNATCAPSNEKLPLPPPMLLIIPTEDLAALIMARV